MQLYLPLIMRHVPPPSLQVISANAYGSGNTIEVVGEIANEGGSPAYEVTLAIQLYNQHDQLIRTIEGYTVLAQTRPGQRNPFIAYDDTVPSDIASFDVAIRDYRLSVPYAAHPLTILHKADITRVVSPTEQHQWVEGTLRNDTDRTLTENLVAATFYGPTGDVRWVDFAPPELATLGPGETSYYGVMKTNNAIGHLTSGVVAEGIVLTPAAGMVSQATSLQARAMQLHAWHQRMHAQHQVDRRIERVPGDTSP
jgi:hypothetical protein